MARLIPCIFVVGQARSSQLSIKTNTRQVGTQEINSLNIVKSITKHSIILSENHNINQELQNAYEIALEGRPGPVWIEVPLDLQLKKVTSFSFKKKSILQKNNNLKTTNIKILKFKKLLLDLKKTVVIAGNGIITSDNVNKFKSFINKFNLPYVCTWLGVNLANVVSKNYCGRIGISGQRGANILIQNAELIIILGSHLCLPQTGVNTKAFAPKAKKILINIDKNEYKASKIKFNEFLNIDLKIFFEKINKIKHSKIQSFKNDTINKIKQLNQIDKIHTEEKKKINQYYFIHRLNKLSIGNENYVIDGGGTNVYISYQALELKKKQKIIHTASICAMGSGLPESIGASSSMKKVICLIGDGSLMFNLQELQTIKTNKLPVKIITFNNNGYVSIRDTQRDFLNSKFYGSSANGGIEITNIKKIAKAFNFYYDFVSEKKSIDIKIKNFLNHTDACLLEVIVDPNQPIAPKQKFIKSKKGIGTPSGLDNMFPYLDYESFLNF